MAIIQVSPLFQDEINAVDPSKTLSFVTNVTYGIYEWSYNGLTITGGSPYALEHGASELLEKMGFRFYCSAPWATVRPSSIPTNLTQTKTQYWMPANSWQLNYGQQFLNSSPPSTNGLGQSVQDRLDLLAAFARFAELNGMGHGVYPAGHRWPSVIGNHLAWFQARGHLLAGGAITLPPPYGTGSNVAGCRFDLDPTHTTQAQRDELVHLCAADLLNVARTENPDVESVWATYKRTNFDASDGDQNISNWVYPFTKAVADKMRAGTAAIDNLPAQAPEPTCQIGLYAYAGHRIPPTEPASATPPGSYKDGVYTQVALAFNDPSITGFTYQQLVEQHGARADAILLREYFGVQQTIKGQPFINNRMRPGSFDWYDGFVGANCVGEHAEYAPNWLNDLPGIRYAIRKCKTGTGTYQDAVDDLMLHLFRRPVAGGEDPKVRELYEDWIGNPRIKLTRYNLRRAFDLIDAMEAGSWYKLLFQYVAIIWKKIEYLPPKIARANNPNWPQPAANDPFPAAHADMMSNAIGVRMDEVTHSYSMMRVWANGYVAQDYPYSWCYGLERSLDYHNDVDAAYPVITRQPEYLVNPVKPIIGGPSDEWAPTHALLIAETPHDIDMDSEDLVLVRGIVPAVQNFNPAANPLHGNATAFNVRYTVGLAFIGPGNVLQTPIGTNGQPTGDPVITSFGPGLHLFQSLGGYQYVTWQGGELFMDTFGKMYKNVGGGPGSHWLYVPQRHAGDVQMEAIPRWTFYDESGRLDLYEIKSPSYVSPANLGPGQIMVEQNNTSGYINNLNCNRWLSAKPTIALMPRVIAQEDFSNRAKVHVL